MIIYPAIDLNKGKCVRLYKGDYNKVTVYGNPVDIAKTFKEKGAKIIHMVDLDGAKNGNLDNINAIKEVLANVDIDIEIGGGIREISQIKMYLDMGVKRVIIGSLATNLEFVKQAISLFGSEKVVIGLDCKNMKIATHGWLNDTNLDAIDYAKKLKEIGVCHIIFTDIFKDGTLSGINFEQTKKLIDETGMSIVASGGASSLEDVIKAKEIGCSGIILGKSLFENKIDLSDALKV